MQKLLDWLIANRPESRLIPLYRKAIEKNAHIECDTMWRMYLDGQWYDANDINELYNTLIYR